MDTIRRAGYIRNFTFGVEDSLVSTVGMLSGIAAAGTPSETILIAGAVLLCVEAFSMGIGSMLSENSAEEFASKTEVSLWRSARDGAIMFFSYLIAGLIPLSPYMFLDTIPALELSVILSLLALFALGAFSAKMSRTSATQQGSLMFVLGGLAIILGMGVGVLLDHWTGKSASVIPTTDTGLVVDMPGVASPPQTL